MALARPVPRFTCHQGVTETHVCDTPESAAGRNGISGTYKPGCGIGFCLRQLDAITEAPEAPRPRRNQRQQWVMSLLKFSRNCLIPMVGPPGFEPGTNRLSVRNQTLTAKKISNLARQNQAKPSRIRNPDAAE